MSRDIVAETMRLLDDRVTSGHESMNTIAQKAGVKRDWLAKLRGGRITEPGANKIMRLNSYLKQYRLPLK